jgi:DNA-binding phage protein
VPLKLTGRKSTPTRSKSTSTRQAPSRRKSSASKQAPTRKGAESRKPVAAQLPANENGNGNGSQRGPKLPEGWSKRDFDRIVRDMQKAREKREKAEQALKQAQADANQMALELIGEGIQMSVVSRELDLSRQWLYKLMEDNGVKTERQSAAKRSSRSNGGTTRSKSAAKRSAAKPAAKKASARKAPAKKAPARKPPAKKTGGRGRVSINR